MRKVVQLLFISLVLAAPAFGAGRGQGAFVIADEALVYEDSEGEAAYPTKLAKGDVVGGFTKIAGMAQNYEFEDQSGRVRVLTITKGRAANGWMTRTDLSSYFTYECGCGLAQAPCSPHALERLHYKWNACFVEAREKALAALQAGATAKPPDTSGPTESIEIRLQKLKDLLSKGLITKEEYDSKRAEILKSM
ncbi:MAG: SHOCT domain-containing protein [Acidobacteriota bacterium]